jgi:ribokinase
MEVAVVGHVEWIEFLRVRAVPAAGSISRASARWEEPAGGGAVAAVQLARLAGRAGLYTALAADHAGGESARLLGERGVAVHAARAPGAQRRGVVFLDDAAERTITVVGDRQDPSGADPLPWPALGACDGVFFCAGDAEALRAARAARVLVATPRAGRALVEAGVEVDVLVHSAGDPGEVVPDGTRGLVVSTEGAAGGRWRAADGREGRFAAAPVPGPPADAYGCGDAFAAGLTYGLCAWGDLERALGLAARCGAAVLTGRGPYPGMLDRDGPPPAGA